IVLTIVGNRMEHSHDKAAIEDALTLLRRRLCDSSSLELLLPHAAENYSKLQYLLSNTVTTTCNNSVLLLGPRGCGKSMVLERVLKALQHQHPDMISIVRLNGLLHSDDRCALKEIAKQLCLEHQLTFSKTASFDENSQFMNAMLRECALAHKAVIFILDEFDLFAQGKQRLLYNLLDAMQSILSQAAVVGISCRLDADQLLEKRVRSRFSHRKLLFSPPSTEDLQRLLEHALVLPTDSTFPNVDYAARFNTQLFVTKVGTSVVLSATPRNSFAMDVLRGSIWSAQLPPRLILPSLVIPKPPPNSIIGSRMGPFAVIDDDVVGSSSPSFTTLA
ncbi:hypothetical protein KI387_035745, partial [Taxus chinensis]